MGAWEGSDPPRRTLLDCRQNVVRRAMMDWNLHRSKKGLTFLVPLYRIGTVIVADVARIFRATIGCSPSPRDHPSEMIERGDDNSMKKISTFFLRELHLFGKLFRVFSSLVRTLNLSRILICLFLPIKMIGG